MTPEQIHLVQASWAKVQPFQAMAADLFYGRLFELAPDTRALFKRDIHGQGRMLMETLDIVVRSLGNLGEVLPVAQQLARRHVDYGVREHHYDRVGTALVWTLERALGAAFTPELRAAWQAAYGTLAGAMKAAAYPAPQPGPGALQPAL
jgi:hemoglobin-like flavoprotein